MNRISTIAVTTSLILIQTACGEATSSGAVSGAMFEVASESAPLVPRIIAPQVTDPDIDWIPIINPQFNHHYVYLDPSAESNSKLFVFLPGANAKPRLFQLIQQEAARLGYHVIGLMYQNSVSPNSCSASTDPECTGNMRLEILDGTDRSPSVDVTPANSINNRLTKLLLFLSEQYPDEGWSQFLNDGSPKWSRIAVGGHSDGAGAAALIGIVHHVYRVAMFSGPAEGRLPAELVAWASIGETPAAKYFALYHQREIGVPGILARLMAFDVGRFGEPVMPELGEPPYDGTHILVTDLEPVGGYTETGTHRSTALDADTPLGPDGTPLLRDAWRYLLSPN